MKGSSKRFLLVAAVAFLSALGWALCTQAELFQKGQLERPQRRPSSEAPPKPPESGTGVYGPVEEDTHQAIQKKLRAERAARKRLDH